jgi:hypothetical protein
VVTDPTSSQSQWVALAQPNETLSDEAVYRLRPSKDAKRMGDCWIPRPQKHTRIFLFWLIRSQPVATCPLTPIPWPSLDLSRRHQPAGVGAHSLTLNSVLSLPYYVLVLMPVVRHSSWGWRWRPNTSHQPLASSYPSSRMSSLAFTGPYWIPPRSSKRLSVHRRANTCQRPQKHCIWYLYWRGKIFRNVSHTTASET